MSPSPHHGRIRRVAGTATALALASSMAFGAVPAIAAPEPATAGVIQSDYRQQVIDVFNGINAFRASNGLAPLRIGLNASAVAQEWSASMARRHTLEHSTSHANDMRVAGWSAAGENIGSSNFLSGQSLVNMWIESPDHKANMSHAADNVIGVGVTEGTDGLLWGSTSYYTYKVLPEKTYATAEEFLAAIGEPAVPAETPVILGAAEYGRTLSLKETTWPKGTALSYKWFAGSQVIPDENKATLLVPAIAAGHAISVEVTAKAPGYRETSVFSAKTAVVPYPGWVENTVAPSISGTNEWGQTLTVNPGTWTPGTTLTYQWSTGETGTTHVIARNEHASSVEITGTKPGMYPTSVTVHSELAKQPLAYTAPPAITGKAVSGEQLSVSPGSWNLKPSMKYIWLRNGIAVAGQSGSTYTLTTQDVGARISVSATASVAGYAPVTVVTAPTAVVADELRPVQNTAKPSISGTAEQGETLTAKPGTWTAGSSFSYQWLRNGSAVSGATGSTFKLTEADMGSKVSVAVTASKAGHLPGTATSDQTKIVTRKTVSYDTTPAISGTPTVGQTLKVEAGNWTPGAVLSYQWYRGSNAISGARGTTYKLVAADAGHRISVTVTGAAINHNSTSVTSAATAAVKKPAVVAPEPEKPKPSKPAFKDVPANMQFSKEIEWMAAEDISRGWSDNTYRPLNNIARDAMSAFTYRLADEPAFKTPAKAPFKDVRSGSAFFKEISWLSSTGVATGWPDNTFRPLDSVNRDAMAAFMYRLAGSPAFTPPKKSPFADVSPSTQFYKEISWLAAQGISTGWDGPKGTKTFRPTTPVKRDAMAAFMYRFDQKGFDLPGSK